MQVTLLDGGMGQELIHRAGSPATAFWATQVMMDHPGLVGAVHADYAAAGATVATTNSYAIHRDRLRGGGSNHYAGANPGAPDLEDRFEDLLALALREASPVRGRCRIAGSIGPLSASYRADLHPVAETATPLYAEVAALLAPGVDILLFETIPSIEAARACLAAGRTTDRAVWLSFTVDDADGRRLRSGEPVTEAAELAREADAVLANCSVPEVMPAALEALSRAGLPMGAYANAFTMIANEFLEGGSTVDVLEARRDMGPEAYARQALAWLDHGATILGGCCETGPAHIAAVHAGLLAAGHEVV